jgi:hypothetical protein
MRTLFLFFAVGLISATMQAQSFIGGGLTVGSVVGDNFSGYDKSIGGFGETTVSRKIAGIRFDFNGLATLEHAPKAGTTSGFELKLRPELRAFAPIPGPVKPFAGGGFQYNYFNSDQYGKSSLNYIATAGAEIADIHTARVSRLFTDRTNFNDNRLEGFRIGYDLTKRFPSSVWAVRFSAEYNRFRYVQPFGPTAGTYDGQSVAFRLGFVKTVK